MCGIVGIVAKKGGGFNNREMDMFEEMLYADALRGMDSTGAFSVSYKNEVKVAKQATNPGIFLATKTFKDWKLGAQKNGRIMVGHNRKATWGDVTSKNAHPFVDKDMVLVHNGYISNHKELDKEVEVDSQAIITALHNEKTVVEGLQRLFGAYALVWYHHKKKKLYMARNKDRPLAVAHTDQHMYIASESAMLRWMFDRNQMGHAGLVSLIPEGRMIEISLDPFKMEDFTIPYKPVVIANNNHSPAVNEGGYIDPWDTVPRDEREGDQSEIGTELGRARAMAQREVDNSDAIETKVKELSKRYPSGNYVLFQLERMIPQGEGTARIHSLIGHAWQPGKTPAKAVCNINAADDEECYIAARVPLLAQVEAIIRRNDDIKLIVKDLRAASSILKDFKGSLVGHEEWKLICSRVPCDTCGKQLQNHQIEGTQVFNKDHAKYSAICSACTAKVEEEMHALGAQPIGGPNGG